MLVSLIARKNCLPIVCVKTVYKNIFKGQYIRIYDAKYFLKYCWLGVTHKKCCSSSFFPTWWWKNFHSFSPLFGDLNYMENNFILTELRKAETVSLEIAVLLGLFANCTGKTISFSTYSLINSGFCNCQPTIF